VKRFILVSSQYERTIDIDYTLNVYCMSPIELTRLPLTLQFPCNPIVSEWNAETSGGNG
jgi:hypothetical protein